MGWGGKGKGWFGKGPPIIGPIVGAAAAVTTGAVLASAERRRHDRWYRDGWRDGWRDGGWHADVVVIEGTPAVQESSSPVVIRAEANPVVTVQPARVVYQGKGKGKRKGTAVVQDVFVEDTDRAILEINVPREAMEARGSDHYFGVDAMEDDGVTYRVMRQYSDFEGLFRQTGRTTFYDAAFPAKPARVQIDSPQMEDLRRGLEKWLRRMASDPRSQPGQQWFASLRKFLAEGRLTMPSAPNAPPVSFSQPGSAREEPQEANGQELVITIPHGVVAGQVIAVNVPGTDVQLTVEVPSGYKSGSDLRLWYDPATGSLKPAV
uniref:PX domain-containing protein n=1 Tax=Noctiluca scintillans TaxID=2966 RepID=A0A7S1EXN0_NOCSC